MSAMIDLNILPIETLKEMANEKAELVATNAKRTVIDAIDCGKCLTAIKEQLEHGKWAAWLGANWNYSQKTAAQYMRISNFTCGLNLKDAKSINEALRMIGDEKDEPEPETAPRSQRKTGQVEVVEPDEPGQTDVQPDDDPTPDPPTQRKTAKGSEKKPESSKPKTPPITPEIIDEPKESVPDERTLSDWSETQILDYLVATAEEPKPRAKRLRKTADRLDPPTKFVKPDLDEVSAYFTELKAVDPDSFFDFYESKGWLVGKVSMKDWRASARKWIRKNAQNGKGDYNGRRTSATQANGSCLGANGRPEIKPRKINYK